MTTKSSEETRSQDHVKGTGGSVAQDAGLNHEAGPGRAQLSVTETIRKLFGHIQREPRKRG